MIPASLRKKYLNEVKSKFSKVPSDSLMGLSSSEPNSVSEMNNQGSKSVLDSQFSLKDQII